MRRTVHQLSLSLLAIVALSLVALGVFLSKGNPETVQASAPFAVPDAQKPDNSQCLACHTQPDQVHALPNGDMVSLTIDSQSYDQAIHANLACQVCHTNITEFPHPENAAQSAREYTLQYKDTCNQCHEEQANQVHDNAHAALAQAGNPNTPICADCHDPHTQLPIQKDANGDPAAVENSKIAETCAKCHSGIVNDYRNSVHGQGLAEKNPDIPACHDCHGIHDLSNARSEEFRLNSPQLCATCHTRADIMDKYGISTNVLSTYVADFHGTTVTLFRHEDPSLPTNKPVCYDCHGVHNIAAVDDPERGLEMKANLLITCQKCHPDASENFPASWLSHYNASPTKFALVYYVDLFYRIFVPSVLGVMALIVLTDVLRRTGITRRKNHNTKEG